ncbi:MAG: DUF4860 domain-containing protein [Clostridia bacterium]|nr:DUF4860 domain-containing protein [Clostridia bacterium]
MNRTGKSHSVDAVFVLSLFCVFAAAILLTLLLGVRSHSAMKTSADRAYYSRTAISYITEKLRHGDAENSVEISRFSDDSSLVLREYFNGTEYTTTIYLCDGQVRELFCESGLDLPPEAGSAIIEGQALSFEKVGESLVKVSYTDPQGAVTQAYVCLRSGGALG